VYHESDEFQNSEPQNLSIAPAAIFYQNCANSFAEILKEKIRCSGILLNETHAKIQNFAIPNPVEIIIFRGTRTKAKFI
jgi:hypothetical protein